MASSRSLKIVLNTANVGALLKSPEMQALLKDIGDRIAASAGPDHSVTVSVGPRRARAEVATTSKAAARRQSRDHQLTQAIDAGRI